MAEEAEVSEGFSSSFYKSQCAKHNNSANPISYFLGSLASRRSKTMAQIRKMDCQVVIKSSADEFYNAFRSKPQFLPKMSNGLIKDVKLLQGDWNSVGAVRLWSYASEGKPQMVKEIFEKVNEKSKTMVYKLVEGDLLNSYNSWRNIITITPVGERSMVKWTMEFEKQNEDIPDPVGYADSLIALTKNIDAYLLNV
uniref:Bet v I/Major latex protein domain-containing protein n=1 Tax=Gossypium raimondii TaxID=29730 RepID=A0A0D2NP62_GOSRA|nr:hypothetical protein B456_002G178000 [Gossypium raimondii]